jgi:hypothetical protein
MEIDSLTCQTELLRGQSGNIVRMFVNPRQDKPANLLPSGVSWRSHRLRSPLLSAYARSYRRLSRLCKILSSLLRELSNVLLRRLSLLSSLMVYLSSLYWRLSSRCRDCPSGKADSGPWRSIPRYHQRQLRALRYLNSGICFGSETDIYKAHRLTASESWVSTRVNVWKF